MEKTLYGVVEKQYVKESVAMIDKALQDCGVKIHKPERLGKTLLKIGKKYSKLVEDTKF
jgi:hypothetical protein